MKLDRRAFIEIAGASALSLPIGGASLEATPPALAAPVPPQRGAADLPLATLVKLNKLPFFCGRDYFVIRSGRAKVIYQVDRADLGPAFTHMVFDVEVSAQTARKENAFNFDPERGFASSALQVVLGGFAYTAFGEQMESRWVDVDGVPAVEAVWWAGGVKVTERVAALAGAEAFVETVQLEGLGLAGDDTVNLKLLVPRGQFRAVGSVLVQSSEKWGCGIAVLGEAKVSANPEEGSLVIGPLAVGPQQPTSVEILRFFQIPARGAEAQMDQARSLTTNIENERQKTRAGWKASTSLTTHDKTLQEIYDKARYGLPGMIADDGTMDAGIFEYGRQ
jgi:hypothetical protein